MKSWSQILALPILWLALAAAPAHAGPFAPGWSLDETASVLRFQSVKNQTKVESSSFATLTGNIDETGKATVKILLDSIDTAVDLRNVRMRFLFFETFQFPEATITAELDEAMVADLPERRRKILRLPVTLDLHGVKKEIEANVAVTFLSNEMVSVASTEPISVAAADYDLTNGIAKLEEAAGVTLIPSATVTFDFMFSRTNATAPLTVAAADPGVSAALIAGRRQSAALETQGNFTREACTGRFEILSRTDNIYFPSGSARLDGKSKPLLDSLVDIVRRCPGLVVEVSGHTDSDGSESANQRLSEARARAVGRYLVGEGIENDRIVSVGHGELQPAFPNDTADNKRRNRRIEFAVVR